MANKGQAHLQKSLFGQGQGKMTKTARNGNADPFSQVARSQQQS